MDNSHKNNIDILKNEPKDNNSKNQKYKQILNKSISDTHDLSNVLNLTGDIENSMDKNQLEIVKDFVRDARTNIDLKDYKKNEINDLIDSEAISKFNFITKVKFYYSKYEWSFIAIREIFSFLIILLSYILYLKSLKSKNRKRLLNYKELRRKNY